MHQVHKDLRRARFRILPIRAENNRQTIPGLRRDAGRGASRRRAAAGATREALLGRLPRRRAEVRVGLPRRGAHFAGRPPLRPPLLGMPRTGPAPHPAVPRPAGGRGRGPKRTSLPRPAQAGTVCATGPVSAVRRGDVHHSNDVTRASSSQNPGNDTRAHSASATVVVPCATTPATPIAMAMRWSS